MIKDALETGINQMSHPNPHIRARLQEHSVSECQYGCKYYQDPKTKVIVLHHNNSYGCKRTKSVIEREKVDVVFADKNVWLVPLKERVDQNVWNNLIARSSGNLFGRVANSMAKGFSEMGEVTKKVAAAISDSFENVG